MRIAQIAPLMESVPPRLYGRTERIVSYLTDELVRLGHEVSLFASADSFTAAKLAGCARMALRLDSNIRTGPLDTTSGGAPAASPQGQPPPRMQAAPEGSSKTIVDTAPAPRR
jgi:hypothetical protein